MPSLISFEKLALCSSALALSASALFRKGENVDPVTLFDSVVGTYPSAKKTDGTTAKASPNTMSWTIKTQSYYDEDLGESYVDFINELTMPILDTDVITFHIEFSSNKNPGTSSLLRDGFDCVLTKDSSSKYWITSDPVDYYVIGSIDTAAVEDFNNSIPTDGQDWFVST